MIPFQNSKPSNGQNTNDHVTAEKIELLVQQRYNITIPSLYLEYFTQENSDFDLNDLKSFYSQFGEVIEVIIKGKISIVLYKNFFDAEVCREFLLNEKNFKENMKKNSSVRWFDYEKDINILPPESKNLFEKMHNKNSSNIKDNNKNKIINMMNNGNINKINNVINNNNLNNNNIINNGINVSINGLNQNNQNHINLNLNQNQNSNNIYMSPNIIMQYNQLTMNQGMQMNGMNNHSQNIQNMHHIPNFGIQNMRMNPSMNIPLFMNQNMNGMNNINGIQINNHQYNSNQKQFNQNMEEKSYGKYTCKYEILIPNDKEFQVARRLIGSKGCNMKKILNECKANNNINENIKLRLRGRGSGYKEGPQNKESDEPLHLCISAKNQEEMKKACAKVDDLLNKIYEEYKKYCFKNNITPVAPQLANRIDCGNSLHKTK